MNWGTRNRRERLVSWMVSALGLVFVSASFDPLANSLAHPVVIGLARSVGLALLVSMAVRLFTLYLYPESHLMRQLKVMGVSGLYHRLSSDELNAILSSARRIEVVKTWFPEDDTIAKGIESAVKKGRAQVSMFLGLPDCEMLKMRSASVHEVPDYGSRKVVKAVRDLRRVWRDSPHLQLQVAFFDGWPGCPIIKVDDHLLLGFYFRDKSSPYWPWLVVEDNSPWADEIENQIAGLKKSIVEGPLRTCNEIDAWLAKNAHLA